MIGFVTALAIYEERRLLQGVNEYRRRIRDAQVRGVPSSGREILAHADLSEHR